MSSPNPDAPPPEGRPDPDDWRCYRHPDREVGVRCARCERPICPDCMVQASVGFQCPACARSGPPVRSLRSLAIDPYATYVLMGISMVLFLPSLAAGSIVGGGAGDLAFELGLYAPFVASGEWWRLVTSGFVHAGMIHLFFNMFILYQLGLMLEPGLGRVRFLSIYAAGLMGGAFGALLLSPNALTVGASGAVFGLMGAAILNMRRRGINPMQSGLGGLLVLNLVLTFVIPNISIGGHLGGLLAGGLAGAIIFATDGRQRARRVAGTVGALAVALVAAAGGLITAVTPLWPV